MTSNMNPRSDRNDAEPVVSPSPIQGSRPFEASVDSAQDVLDSAYDVMPAWDAIGRKGESAD